MPATVKCYKCNNDVIPERYSSSYGILWMSTGTAFIQKTALLKATIIATKDMILSNPEYKYADETQSKDFKDKQIGVCPVCGVDLVWYE